MYCDEAIFILFFLKRVSIKKGAKNIKANLVGFCGINYDDKSENVSNIYGQYI